MAFGLKMLWMPISQKPHKEAIPSALINAQRQTDDSDENDLNYRNFGQQLAAEFPPFRPWNNDRGIGSDDARFFGIHDRLRDAQRRN